MLAVTPVYQGIYSDPAYQLKAVQQKLAGETWSINARMRPDGSDLSRDFAEWIAWWTPGTQIVVYPFMRFGLPLGTAVRAVAALALIAGAVGWATWFSLFPIPEPMQLAMAAAFPFIRYASNGVFLYSAETLVFAAGPWMLIATTWTLDRNHGERRLALGRHVLLGLALGAAYWLKDSLGFVAFGATAALAVDVWRERSEGLRIGVARCVATAAGAAIPFVVLVALNQRYGPLANKVIAAFGANRPSASILLDALAVPALQMADAFGMWDYVLMHPSHPVVRDVIWISVIGAPGGVLLWWLVRRTAASGAAVLVARSVLVCSLACVVVIWTISAAVDHKPRHVASAAFAVLPLVVSEGCRRWHASSLASRTVLAAGAAAYLCIPMAYGVVSVAAKVARFPRGYRPGPARIYNPLLAETNLAAVREQLLSGSTPDVIWYVPDPISALDLPGRAITTTADFDTLDELKAARYVTSRPARVRVLLTDKFAHDGKADAIRASFPQAGPWHMQHVDGSDYQLWTAHLKEN